jgi:hypothetical protein
VKEENFVTCLCEFFLENVAQIIKTFIYFFELH